MQKIYIEVKKSKLEEVLPEIQKYGQVLGDEESFRTSNDNKYCIIEINTEDIKAFDALEAQKKLKWFHAKHQDGEATYCIHCYLKKYKRWKPKEITIQ